MIYFSEENKVKCVDEFSTIIGNSVDELVKNGVYHILTSGKKISSRAGDALQAYGVNYVLRNPRNRLHHLRDGAIKYLTRELLAYFSGKLKAEEALAKASKFWMTLIDEYGNVNSNYGYYVFYEPVEKYGSQYNWVKTVLLNNNDSRRAIININQNYHKSETKDFPCTIGIQFYIKDNYLFCEVMSRSTDVITGLPYDMGFFSFLHELMWKDLTESGIPKLMLGNTVMKTTFTQIYDKSLSKANLVAESIISNEYSEMPIIESAHETLVDILTGSKKTYLLQWIDQHAK
ncbi:thymidylate synthase [Salmonella enterica]|nr:thymidylate synthase [Salmonella enterica]EAX3607174.1 thymidylate synthase [Salmonella enterica]EGW6280810.1 thymidylate synthase [Salmonella enterica]EGX3932498.1 thymidylate synthase [Salmonella enterica]